MYNIILVSCVQHSDLTFKYPTKRLPQKVQYSSVTIQNYCDIIIAICYTLYAIFYNHVNYLCYNCKFVPLNPLYLLPLTPTAQPSSN